ncbi:hypothetical protein ALC60_13192 [Trachymyrmex zeteki]|uniref:Odorant receptor 13a n=1 Tax=Mycetomoellerius zeteki TaxID=64791 RepID=A0A151WIU1_9HYME|nr:hypothetical protein ALC60_13192 [Trachymyrmex zeteki]
MVYIYEKRINLIIACNYWLFYICYSYRIICALDKSVSMLLTLNKGNIIRVKLIEAVELHQRTLELLCQITILPDERKDLVPLHVVYVFAQFSYLFICNYMGQKIIDSSTEFFRKIYDTQWYMAPVQMQKLLLFVMQRSIKSCNFIVGDLYCVSLELFTTLFLATQYLSNSEECITAILFVLGHICYIFFGNYTSQKLIDQSTDVFYKIFFDLIISSFTVPFAILIVTGVISMSINLYYLLLPSTRQNVAEMLSIISIITCHLIYMFGANYGAQIVTDHNDDFFNATCNALWYIAPLSSQKIFLFLMLRTIKKYKPAICSVFVGSLEGFATVIYVYLNSLSLSLSLSLRRFVVAFAIFFIIIIELIPVVLDAVTPMNKSRPRKVKIDFEFFIDEEQYFYVYLIYEIITILIGIFTILSTGTLSFALIRHCCATFKIASNLIERTVTQHTLQIPTYHKTHVMCQRINRAVHIHRKSIQLLINALTVSNEFSEIIMCIGMVTAHFMVLFASNFVGQSVSDHSAEIFNAA